MTLLGNMVLKKMAIVDPYKVELIKNRAKLINMIEIYRFVVLASYNHQFITRFTTISLYMTYLIQKKV